MNGFREVCIGGRLCPRPPTPPHPTAAAASYCRLKCANCIAPVVLYGRENWYHAVRAEYVRYCVEFKAPLISSAIHLFLGGEFASI